MSRPKARPASQVVVAGGIGLDELVMRLSEVAELSRAGLSGSELWQPLLGRLGSDGGLGTSAAAGQSAQDVLDHFQRLCQGGPAELFASAVAGVDQLAQAAGAAVGEMLDCLIASVESHQEATDAMEAALAGPQASARLLQYLPLAGLGLGAAMGVNVLGTLTDAGLGTAIGLVGLGLLIAGRAWTKWLVNRAKGRPDVDALVAIDMLMAALGAGLTIPAALSGAGQAWPGPTGSALAAAGSDLAAGASWERAWAGSGDRPVLAGIERALALTWRSGVSCVGLLAGLKTATLRAERQRVVKDSAKLGVSLMLPLGTCYLPSFIALGLGPLVLSLFNGLSLTL